MKRVLYILNDCMRKFTYERTAGLQRAIQRMEEPVNLYIVRSDGYFDFASEHNRGEYNIYRLPDYRDFDGIILDVNSILDADADSDSYTRGFCIRCGKQRHQESLLCLWQMILTGFIM